MEREGIEADWEDAGVEGGGSNCFLGIRGIEGVANMEVVRDDAGVKETAEDEGVGAGAGAGEGTEEEETGTDEGTENEEFEEGADSVSIG